MTMKLKHSPQIHFIVFILHLKSAEFARRRWNPTWHRIHLQRTTTGKQFKVPDIHDITDIVHPFGPFYYNMHFPQFCTRVSIWQPHRLVCQLTLFHRKRVCPTFAQPLTATDRCCGTINIAVCGTWSCDCPNWHRFAQSSFSLAAYWFVPEISFSF